MHVRVAIFITFAVSLCRSRAEQSGEIAIRRQLSKMPMHENTGDETIASCDQDTGSDF